MIKLSHSESQALMSLMFKCQELSDKYELRQETPEQTAAKGNGVALAKAMICLLAVCGELDVKLTEHFHRIFYELQSK